MRRQHWILLLLVLVAFALRLAYWERSASFGSYELSYDDDEYFKAGILFARGEFLRDPYPLRYTRSPGYPLTFAPLLAAFGPRLEIILAFQVCVSVLSVALTYLVARRAFGNKAGLWAAGLMAIAPNYASLAGSFLLTETLFAFGALLFIYLFWRWTDKGMRWWQALCIGALAGYMALIRGQALYFFILAALWYVYEMWRHKTLSWKKSRRWASRASASRSSLRRGRGATRWRISVLFCWTPIAVGRCGATIARRAMIFGKRCRASPIRRTARIMP